MARTAMVSDWLAELDEVSRCRGSLEPSAHVTTIVRRSAARR